MASAVNMVAAQRLTWCLCSRCKQPIELSCDVLASSQFQENPDIKPTFFKPVGCQYCRQTGYSGRIALIEVITVNDEIRKLILTNTEMSKIKGLALQNNMKTLRQVGLMRASEGITSIEEVLRVTKAD